jgi:hypothetical protein
MSHPQESRKTPSSNKPRPQPLPPLPSVDTSSKNPESVSDPHPHSKASDHRTVPEIAPTKVITTATNTIQTTASSTQRDYRRLKRGTSLEEIRVTHDRGGLVADVDPELILRQGRKEIYSRRPIDSIIQPRDIPPKPIAPFGTVFFTDDDVKAIQEYFPGSSGIRFSWPFVVIAGVSPPTKPVTVKGLVPCFVKSLEDFKYAPGIPGNPRILDPVPRIPAETIIGYTEMEKTLGTIINATLPIHSLSLYYGHIWSIEVDTDKMSLDKLPGRVAGRVALWSKFDNGGHRNLARPTRGKDPLPDVTNDDTDYRIDGLCPGIKVCGLSYATSAGALLVNSRTGEERLSVANHGWKHHEYMVYHPNLPHIIATIDEKDHDYDVALAKLAPDLFTNLSYFGSPVPKHFITTGQVDQHVKPASFFACNGFTTGQVWMFWQGRRLDVINVPAGEYKMHRSLIFHVDPSEILATGGTPVNGICGAPVVHQEESDIAILDGACCGFFSWWSGVSAFVPCTDSLLARGWEIKN